MPLLIVAPPSFLTLRLISVHYSRQATSFFLAGWLSLWPFFFEKINQTKVQNSTGAIAMNLFNIPSILHLFSQPLERKRE
jgi:hypothetical protein